MAGADLYPHSSSKWVNLWTPSLAWNETVQIPSFMYMCIIGVMVIRLREFKEKKKNTDNYFL